jgi:hypothetical protein
MILYEENGDYFFGPNKYCKPYRDTHGWWWRIWAFDGDRHDKGRWYHWRCDPYKEATKENWYAACEFAMERLQEDFDDEG